MQGKSEKNKDFVVYRNVKIPMRDGTRLSADVYFPSKNGVVDFAKKYPVLLSRSPYLWLLAVSIFPFDVDSYATGEGFVFINNAVRGTYTSEGIYEPMQNEGWGEKQDGVDTVTWITKQPWCNGQVATCGISYLGGTQLLLQLSGDVPGLETSVITCPAVNSFDGSWIYAEDFLDAGCVLPWVVSSSLDDQLPRLSQEDQQKVLTDQKSVSNNFTTDLFGDPMGTMAQLTMMYRENSLADMPVARHFSYWRNWIANRDNPEFFSFDDTSRRSHAVSKPVLITGSWYDLFNHNSLHAFERFVAEAPSEKIAKGHRLIVGPWGHTGINPLYRAFPGSETDFSKMTMEWTKQQLLGETSAFFQNNPVSLYVMGENRWRSEQTWPLPDTVPTRFYLHSAGMANTFMGNGTLSLEAPNNGEAPDHYLSDPTNPVASMGGHSSAGGAADQRMNELRGDVLVYTTPVLEEDVEVTGYITATIYASTSATDTDFFVKLIDVMPDGVAYNISTGGRRGRYLKNGRTAPEALIPGEIAKWEISMKATSNVFKKGHRIRVEISSSDFTNRDVNPNCFVDLATATKEDYVIAQQTIFHDAEHPSMIELPVIPVEHKREYLDWPFADGEDTMNMQDARKWTEANKPAPAAELDGELLETTDL